MKDQQKKLIWECERNVSSKRDEDREKVKDKKKYLKKEIWRRKLEADGYKKEREVMDAYK